MISKTKTCGGGYVTTARLSKPITKQHIPLLKSNGFSFNDRFISLGLLRAKKESITINGSFGNKIITLDCNGSIEEQACDSLIQDTLQTIQNLISQ